MNRFAIWGTGVTLGALPQTPARNFVSCTLSSLRGGLKPQNKESTLVTQPSDAPRRAVSPSRSPRSRVQGVPARFNGGDGVLRGFRGRNRNLPLIP